MEYSDQSCVEQQHEAQAVNETQFNNSLQELKDLSSQLHNAADYCQSTFLNAQHKGVVENTKEYVCKAVVIIVDHLGSISSNLEYTLSKTNTVPQTQLRIDTLKQRLLTCQQYSHKLALTNIYWNADFQRYRCRYLSPNADSATKNQESSTRKTDGSSNPGFLVRDGLPILPKPEQTYFQFQKAPKVKRGMLNWKVFDNTTIKSRIMRRRDKRILT
ncbi:Protein ABIL4 [Abeliophyllum distichum]|uniref:Protein ABIL4 n=1 Tax=Abeliophyllum distichum TaxID=126358 RepID=A0ABD1QUB6_9LAMI